MMSLISTLVKIAIASLITGAVLSAMNLSAQDILAQVGMTPEELYRLLVKGTEWALPNILLGSFVIVPIWLMVLLFRPPRG